MSRSRIFKVSGINIRVHSRHHPSEYTALWAALHQLGKVHVRGHIGLVIGNARPETIGTNEWVVGYFYTFVDIDPSQRWLNVETRSEAQDGEVAGVQIPENLRPNMVEIPYVFDTTNHQLIFVTKEKSCALGPNNVKRLLQHLAAHHSITSRFGTVDLTVMTEIDEVNAMLRWPVIRRLHLTLERINPTDYQDDEEVFRRLQELGAKREERTYIKDQTERTLILDESLQRVAVIAAQNGEVEVVGQDATGKSGRAKSQQFPMVKAAEYMPARTNLISALLQYAIDTIRSRRDYR